jgi:molybdenum cofactor biosynthesis enzyme
MVDDAYVYAFEELAEDLPRPPMAALRALQSKGYLVSPRGWRELPLEVRQALAREGARDKVGGDALEGAIRRISLQHVKLMPSAREPSAEQVPPQLSAALGPLRALSADEWRGLRALDRRVLALLASNTRLLGRAVAEILPTAPISGGSHGPSALVARCEIALRPDVLQEVMDPGFQGGRAFVLARVAGRRAARRVAEIFDTQADSTVGPVELDWGVREADSVIFWQAHASAWDGSFFPSAALLAATTAAVALHDMVKDLDPVATLGAARVRDEPWEAGRGEFQDAPTAIYANLGPLVAVADGKSFGATMVTGPPSMDPVEYPVPSSSPRLMPLASIPPSLRAPPSSGRRLPAPPGPSARLFVVVSVIAVMAVLGLIVVAIGLARSAGRL